MARQEVRKGQRYCNADAPFIVWSVGEILKDGAGLPHARLTRVGEAYTTKTVAFSALKDARLYRFIGEPPEDNRAA